MLALLAGAYAVHAQGTVSLANYAQLSPYIYVSYQPTTGSPVLLGGAGAGAPAPTLSNYALETGNGADWTIALYGAPGAGTPVPLTTGLGSGPFVATTFESGNSVQDVTAGTWYTSIFGTISGAAGNGSAATVQLAAWYNAGGVITSLSQAQADGVPWGESAAVSTTTGGPAVSGPAAVAANLPAIGNFTVQTTVPEPSTIALGLIGASTFLMRLRRK